MTARRSIAAALLVAATFVTALASGCSAAVTGSAAPDPVALTTPAPFPTPTGDEYADPDGRFRLVPPPGWVVDTSGQQETAVRFVDPEPTLTPAGPKAANVNVFVVAAGIDLTKTVLGTRRELGGVPGYKRLVDEPATLHDGTPAHVFGGTFTDRQSGVELRNVQVYAVRDGTTIVATGTAPSESWSSYEATFTTIVHSLSVAG
ncbi:DUF1795 domain-containing protein [Pseudonocardia sp. TRM90224]|uniref:DUF1795 domain-containing protein n=1 Tax=Pseudonocardia sp. TRM90224 TaxID=2812678 RepID=UPI001E48E888|nr:DUF1795 domain-containing protein [Pseudonocardia sp. TRM90224]